MTILESYDSKNNLDIPLLEATMNVKGYSSIPNKRFYRITLLAYLSLS